MNKTLWLAMGVWLAAGMGMTQGLMGCHARRAAQPTAVIDTPRKPDTAAAQKQASLGDAYFEKGRTAEALRAWQIALVLNPDQPDLLAKVRQLEQNAKHGPATQSTAGPTPKDTPGGNDVDGRTREELERAETLYRRSRLKEADLAWRHVLEIEPGNATAQAGLERLQKEAYRPDAQRPFDRMTQELYDEGLRAMRQEAWAQAELKLAEALKLNPGQPQVQDYLSRARQELATVTRREQKQAAREGAQRAEQAQQWVTAQEHWQTVARLDPQDEDARRGLERSAQALTAWAQQETQTAEERLQSGDPQAALAAYQRVLAVLPEFAVAKRGAHKMRGLLAGKSHQAMAQAEARRRLEQGQRRYQEGQLAQALQIWEEALTFEPENAEIKRWSARVRQELQHQRETNDRQAEARYADGLAAYQRGELDEALAAWKEAAELNPQHEKAKANIRRVEKEMR